MVVCRTVAGGEVAVLTGHARSWPPWRPAWCGSRTAPTRRWRPSTAASWRSADNRVIILSDVAELAKDIDVSRAEKAKSEATGDDEEAVEARKRADARLDAAKRAS